jgi:hypothetical protein
MTWPVRVAGLTERERTDLCVTVLFTNAEGTRLALNSALKLAQGLDASIRIVVTRVVPYPLPLDNPPVDITFTEKQVVELAKSMGVEAAVHIYDCRDPEATLVQILPAGSVVIVGSRKKWWRIRERMLARKLRKAGHDVIVTGAE